jgi:hypothetical protein
MTTDTALGVTKLVVQDKISLDKIPYVVRIISAQVPSYFSHSPRFRFFY